MKVTILNSVAIKPNLIRSNVLFETDDGQVTTHEIVINTTDFCIFGEDNNLEINIGNLQQNITDQILPAITTGVVANILNNEALSWPVVYREPEEQDDRLKLAYGETDEVNSEVNTGP